MRRFFVVAALFGCSVPLFSQIRPLIYFSQTVYGATSYLQTGQGGFAVGDINQDSIADVAWASDNGFQVGYGRIENGLLHLDIQAIDFLDFFKFRHGQLNDMDGDGDLDFTMQRAFPYINPTQYDTYLFENQGDSIETVANPVSLFFQQNTWMHYGHYNEDQSTDTHFKDRDTLKIVDGASGQTQNVLISDHQIFTIDLNGDGLLDFIEQVENFPSSNDTVHRVYLNEGGYSFALYASGGFVKPEGFGDFDGDGMLDMVSADGPARFTLKTKLMGADSAEIIEVFFANPDLDSEFYVYDLNEDGFSDLIVFTENHIYFLKNNQDKTFQSYPFPLHNPGNLRFNSHPSWPVGTLISELGASPFIYRLAFDGATFSAERSSNAIQPPVPIRPPYNHRVAALDLDMDASLELALAINEEILVAELENDTFRHFSALSIRQPDFSKAGDLKTADLNNDGLLDLLYSEPNAPGRIQVQYGQTDSTLSDPTMIGDSMRLCFNIQTADFDGNGFLDVVAGSNFRQNLALYLNLDGTQFIENQVLEKKIEHFNIIDPNRDGAPDLAVSWSGGTKIFMNDGLGNFQDSLVLSGWTVPNHNQQTHFVATTSGLLYAIDSSGFRGEIVCSDGIGIDIQSRISYALDYNLDGLPDLLFNKRNGFPNNTPDTAYLALADTTNGTWQLHVFPNRYVQAVEDLDGDGTEDVLWQIGPQLWVELLDSPVWSGISKTVPDPLRIFPNPCADFVQFDFPKNEKGKSVQVWDSKGQLYLNSSSFSAQLDMRQFPLGLYFVLVKMESGKVLGGQFVKQ